MRVFVCVQSLEPVDGCCVVEFQLAHVGDEELEVDLVVFDEEDAHAVCLYYCGVDGDAAVEEGVVRN